MILPTQFLETVVFDLSSCPTAGVVEKLGFVCSVFLFKSLIFGNAEHSFWLLWGTVMGFSVSEYFVLVSISTKLSDQVVVNFIDTLSIVYLTYFNV